MRKTNTAMTVGTVGISPMIGASTTKPANSSKAPKERSPMALMTASTLTGSCSGMREKYGQVRHPDSRLFHLSCSTHSCQHDESAHVHDERQHTFETDITGSTGLPVQHSEQQNHVQQNNQGSEKDFRHSYPGCTKDRA